MLTNSSWPGWSASTMARASSKASSLEFLFEVSMKSAIVFGAIILGFTLLVLSGLWAKLFPATSSWTPEKATRSAEVKDRLNNLSFMLNRPPSMHRGSDTGTLKAEFDQLMKENEQLNSEFQTAYDRPNTI